MSWSKAKQADWQRRYQEAGHIYTLMDCGCIAWVMVDMEDEVRAAKSEIAEQVAKGREIKRCGRHELPPFQCDAHHREPVAL